VRKHVLFFLLGEDSREMMLDPQELSADGKCTLATNTSIKKGEARSSISGGNAVTLNTFGL
jgi:hypothetical protein